MRKITAKQFEKLLAEPESERLDFKEDHSTKGALIKDILALANSRTIHKHRYLIFGISDDKSVWGVQKSARRKKQAEIVQLLRDYAINKMPFFKHYTIDYNGHEIRYIRYRKYVGAAIFFTEGLHG